MEFNVSVPNLINLIIIAAGIGVSFLCFLQISASAHLKKELRRYFQLFFQVIIIYIGTHLARQLMDGIPGEGVRTSLYIVTFVEVMAAGFLAYLMSVMVLEASQLKERYKMVMGMMTGWLLIHAVLLIVGQFTGLIYTFDEYNVYARAPGYLLSNLAPLAMLIIDVVLLLKHRGAIERRVRSAFWVYLITPLMAIGIQSVSYGVQFIILATVGSAIYMFQVIVKQQTAEYQKQQVEASRLDTELSMATRIQADMLPSIFPAFPERDEFDIYAVMTPAKEVGGDFYDFFLIDNEHLGIVIADVSGKGVPAALFMMVSMILVQNYAMMGLSPKEVLESVNDQICRNNREEMFVTVWFGKLDIASGVLVAANAGHENPAFKKNDGSFNLIPDKHGFVIGGMEGMKYTEYEIPFGRGDKLFLYTDGVAEASNADKELYGTDRMIEALRLAERGDPEEIISAVSGSVKEFASDAPQFDDITMVCLEYKA